MHDIEPYHKWLKFYDSSSDRRSPFHGKEYNYELFTETIYGYYINPAWDFIGSETLYIKILFIDYKSKVAIIECMGEWNDAINNDIMHFKRNIIDELLSHGISKYILIGENVFNFHGSDDSYYEEWFDDVEEGYIVAIGFRDYIHREWKKYSIDCYVNYGGNLEIDTWRTYTPAVLTAEIHKNMSLRLG